LAFIAESYRKGTVDGMSLHFQKKHGGVKVSLHADGAGSADWSDDVEQEGCGVAAAVIRRQSY